MLLRIAEQLNTSWLVYTWSVLVVGWLKLIHYLFRFGNFLHNNEDERGKENVYSTTVSLWDHIRAVQHQMKNASYSPISEVHIIVMSCMIFNSYFFSQFWHHGIFEGSTCGRSISWHGIALQTHILPLKDRMIAILEMWVYETLVVRITIDLFDCVGYVVYKIYNTVCIWLLCSVSMFKIEGEAQKLLCGCLIKWALTVFYVIRSLTLSRERWVEEGRKTLQVVILCFPLHSIQHHCR